MIPILRCNSNTLVLAQGIYILLDADVMQLITMSVSTSNDSFFIELLGN